jgi:hypothetical protein
MQNSDYKCCFIKIKYTTLGDMEKEELRNALVLTQESAAIQILLECCLPTPQERASASRLSALQAHIFPHTNSAAFCTGDAPDSVFAGYPAGRISG